MTPFFLDKFSPNPLVEGNQDQSSLSPFTLAAAHASSFSFPFFLTTPQYQGLGQMDHHLQQQQQQQQQQPPPLHQEPPNLLMVGTGSSYTTTNNDQNVAVGDRADPQGPGKWMSSKMRIMRKMMNSDDGRRLVMTKPRRNFRLVQDQPPNDQGGVVRVCSDCNTTKTPLWRSGPRGPKSLCNACGIRQRKARRAMAAKGLVGNDTASTKARKVKRSYNIVDRSTLPFKKRCKITISSETSNNKKKKLRFDDVAVRFSKNSAFHRVFPKDERDAAVLLMALSCGLIRG